MLEYIESRLLEDETSLIKGFLNGLPHTESARLKAKCWIEELRSNKSHAHFFQAFLAKYGLDTNEGVLLMCLAESLLRVPDSDTAKALIDDKITANSWQGLVTDDNSFMLNAAGYALLFSGKVLGLKSAQGFGSSLGHLIARLGEPVIKQATVSAMQFLGKQFVLAETIEDALQEAHQGASYESFSFDMLGEAAQTKNDAERYYLAYEHAIKTMAKTNLRHPPTLSIKLSALHPRFQSRHYALVKKELLPKLENLLKLAFKHNISVTIDAEEAHRRLITTRLIEECFDFVPKDSEGLFGVALQAYLKGAPEMANWLDHRAREQGFQLAVRLVKGAYWDGEIKRAQQLGLKTYPVYTQKSSTDIAYLKVAQEILISKNLSGRFATHNAMTIASILELSKGRKIEFQRLFGMGKALYQTVASREDISCRIYAPVGSYKTLLPYLIRRLLENGANSSFVNQVMDDSINASSLAVWPQDLFDETKVLAAPTKMIATREQASGFDIEFLASQQKIKSAHEQFFLPEEAHQKPFFQHSPATQKAFIHKPWTNKEQLEELFKKAQKAQREWSQQTPLDRAQKLNAWADLMASHQEAFWALLAQEAGKTIHDAIDEVREAIDFCRYYANESLSLFKPSILPSYTGERNVLYHEARGVFICISPWNFPLAITTGQIAAALATGNAVIAKPAEQTLAIADLMHQLAQKAMIPTEVFQLVFGDGQLGAALVNHKEVAGVAFTGSTATAQSIAQSLAKKDGPLAKFIAETGGLNAMIVDSTVLPEQVVHDVVDSAFKSAGQRCSALRWLWVQDEIYDEIVLRIQETMQTLIVGLPEALNTDIGPLIDENAYLKVTETLEKYKNNKWKVYQTPCPRELLGYFIAPALVELPIGVALTEELFGPVLHVSRFSWKNLEQVIDTIHQTGFGLTFGIHSRITKRTRTIAERIKAGNIYINRSTIGAVVGMQPFGGQGLSGTGPKAGGCNYLKAFVTEKTVTENTAAIGGNWELMSQKI